MAGSRKPKAKTEEQEAQAAATEAGEQQPAAEEVPAVVVELVDKDEQIETIQANVFVPQITAPGEPDVLPELSADAAYQKLVLRCRKVLGGIVERYWELGKNIAQYLGEADRENRYGQKIYLKLGRDLGMDYSTIYRARNFYQAVPEAEKSLFVPIAWRKVRQLTPLLEHEAAKSAVISQLDQIKDMSPAQFKEWLIAFYKEFLGDDYKQPGRPQGQSTDAEGTLKRHVQVLKNMAAKKELPPVVEDFDDGSGFFATLSYKQGENTEQLVQLLQGLIDRLKS